MRDAKDSATSADKTVEIELFNDVGMSDKYTQVLTINVPPLLDPVLAPIVNVVAGTALEWTIGSADWAPFSARGNDPFVISIPASLASYLSFDESQMKFTIVADRAVKDAANTDTVIDVQLFND